MQVYNIRAEFIPVNFDIPAKLVEKTIQANGVYNATSDDADGYSSVTVVVPEKEVKIQKLDVVPSTSSQSFPVPAGVDGFAPVNVAAVTSTIDSNIQPENIRENVTILGTTGTYKGPAYCIEKTMNNSNSLINGATSIIDLPERIGSNSATGEGYYVLAYAYYGNRNLAGTIDLSNVRYLMGYGTCEYMFSKCPYITGINLGNLEAIIGLGSAIFDSFARQCTALTSVNIDKFYQVSGSNIFDYSFDGCTALTSFKFTSLKVFYGSNNLTQLFYHAFSGSGIQDIYFPAVKESTFYMPNSTTLYSNCINNIINGIAGCTLHFPKNLDPAGGSTVLSSLNGYPNFGGTNTVLAFDQPSTVILTGLNSQAYERSPKDDTATALAWRKQDVGTPQQGFTVDWTPYYTNGTADPQVGATIYNDSACTQTVTTIGAIA